MAKSPRVDFKLLATDAEAALGIGSGRLIENHRAPYTIAADGKRYVWAGDVIRATRPRFPDRAFAKMQLQKAVGQNG